MKAKLLMFLDKAKGFLLPLVKPLYKMVVVKYIQEEGDRLQEKLANAIEKHGTTGARKEIDRMLGAIQSLVMRIPFVPDRIKRVVSDEIENHGEDLKKKAVVAIIDGGIPAFNLVFDAFQVALIAKVEAS